MLDSRETPVTIHYGFGNTCSVTYSGSYQGIKESEVVESYRGKPQHLYVGVKKRKKFNNFYRAHYTKGADVQARVCESDPKYKGVVSDFPIHDILGKSGGISGPESGKGTEWSGDLPPIPFHSLVSYGERFRDLAIMQCYERLNSPDFDGLVFLAELSETVDSIKTLLGETVKTLTKATSAVRNIRHLILNPEEMWLFYRYVLLPSMMDIEDLVNVITDKTRSSRVQTGSQNDIQESGTFTLLGYGGGYYDIDIPWNADISCRCGTAIDTFCRVDPHKFGFSAMDMLRAAWERLPYSFVSDWFIDLGSWLTTLRDVHVEMAQSYASFAITSKTTLKSATYWQMNGESHHETFVLSRITDIEPSQFPLADRNIWSLNRSIDAISLTLSLLKSTLKRSR
jgi:hypothetical protein